jgi:hypothetical protein
MQYGCTDPHVPAAVPGETRIDVLSQYTLDTGRKFEAVDGTQSALVLSNASKTSPALQSTATQVPALYA